MDIHVDFDFTIETIPPRARKPRPTTIHGETTVTVREVTGDEAPIAIRADGTDYRWFDGQLYTQMTRWTGEPRPVAVKAYTDDYAERQIRHAGWVDESEALGHLEKSYARDLIIDGYVHEIADEPTYSYVTLGLDLRPAPTIGAVDYRRPTSHFAARDREAFLAAMRSCVIDNNRAEDVDAYLAYLDATPTIDVIIEEAAQFQTPTRAEYFAERWESTYADIKAAVVATLGSTSSENAVDRLLTAVIDHLVSTKGEWGVIRALSSRYDWQKQEQIDPTADVVGQALAEIGATTGRAKRATLTIEFVHDGAAPDLGALLKLLSGTTAGEAYLTGAISHPVPDDMVDEERDRLALASVIELDRL